MEELRDLHTEALANKDHHLRRQVEAEIADLEAEAAAPAILKARHEEKLREEEAAAAERRRTETLADCEGRLLPLINDANRRVEAAADALPDAIRALAALQEEFAAKMRSVGVHDADRHGARAAMEVALMNRLVTKGFPVRRGIAHLQAPSIVGAISGWAPGLLRQAKRG
jgi:hypothetical protein